MSDEVKGLMGIAVDETTISQVMQKLIPLHTEGTKFRIFAK